SVQDNQTATPFSGVMFGDADTGESAFTASVTLSDKADGVLSNLAGGSYASATGVYVTAPNITLAAAQAAVRGLVFTPTNHQVAPGSIVTTTFTIQVTDGALTPSDSSTTVVATALNTATTIGGTTAVTSIHDDQTATPFGGVTFGDADTGELFTVSVTLSDKA